MNNDSPSLSILIGPPSPGLEFDAERAETLQET
jgi:hypothetical protein